VLVREGKGKMKKRGEGEKEVEREREREREDTASLSFSATTAAEHLHSITMSQKPPTCLTNQSSAILHCPSHCR